MALEVGVAEGEGRERGLLEVKVRATAFNESGSADSRFRTVVSPTTDLDVRMSSP